MSVLWLQGDAACPTQKIAEQLGRRYDLVPLDLAGLIRLLPQRQALLESPKAWLEIDENGLSPKLFASALLEERAAQENLLLLFPGAPGFLPDYPYISGAQLTRDLKNYSEVEAVRSGCQAAGILAALEAENRRQRRFSNTLFAGQTFTPHISLNCDLCSIDSAVRVLGSLWEESLLFEDFHKSSLRQKADLHLSQDVLLKNESEIDMAHILELYHIDYRYEPKTFPVEWDEEGRVSLAFSPDFYLPAFDLYLELTTMNQDYVRLKKKKLQRLRELYPEVNCRIVYKRDFLALIEHLNDD